MATSQERRSPDTRTIPALIRWHGYAALACVLYVALLGLVMSIKLHAPDWLGGVVLVVLGAAALCAHAGLFFGWLGNAFLAFLYFAVPRLAGRPVTGVRLGLGPFRRLERAARAARLGPGSVGRKPAARMGRVPAPRATGRRPWGC